MFILIFILAIVVCIMFHEWGHFYTARKFGMKCEKFFLGFGPTLWSFQRGETEYGVKAIPAGGFVKILGMSPSEEIDPADRGRTFYEKPAWQRAIVLCAGSATHFVFAAVLVWSIFAIVGVPGEDATTTVEVAMDDSPAVAAGIERGDRITAVDGVETADFEAVRQAVVANAGETVTVSVERDGQTRDVSVALGSELPDGTPGGYLGVAPRAELERYGAIAALDETFRGEMSIWNMTWLNLQGIANAFSPSGIQSWIGDISGDEPRSAEGPMSLVGAGQVVNELGQRGEIAGILFALASLNLVLGTLNMLPLPPLDGGHLASLGVERSVNAVRRLRGRTEEWRLDPVALTPISLMVILLFGAVFLTALYIDIVNPASSILQ